MPIGNKQNITLGVGVIEIGSYVNDVFTAYEDIGAIKAEVRLEIVREILEFETGRPLITIVQEVIRERVTVIATLAELTIANLKSVLGQGAVVSSTTPAFLDGTTSIYPGNLSTTKTLINNGTLLKFGGSSVLGYVGLRFIHERSNGKRDVFEGYKASPSGNLTLPFRESDWNTFEAQFRLLADTTKASGEQYFQYFIET